MKALCITVVILVLLFIAIYYGTIAYFKHKIIKGTPPKIYLLDKLEEDLQNGVFSDKQIEIFKRCFDTINDQLTGQANSQSSNAIESLHQLETTLKQKQNLASEDLVLVEFGANDTLNQTFDKPFTHKAFVSALKSATIGMYDDNNSQTYYAICDMRSKIRKKRS